VISSCAPTISKCPYGSTTTETSSLYTTYCPVSESPLVTAPISSLKASAVGASSVLVVAASKAAGFSSGSPIASVSVVSSSAQAPSLVSSSSPPNGVVTLPVISSPTQTPAGSTTSAVQPVQFTGGAGTAVLKKSGKMLIIVLAVMVVL